MSIQPPLSTNENVKNVVFDEEPLALGPAQGYGYAPIRIGDLLGPNDRFEVICKLGWGRSATVWMVKDREQDRFLALKVLTAYATYLVELEIPGESTLDELRILQRISQPTSSPGVKHCIHLIDSFSITCHGEKHICLLSDACGPDLRILQRLLMKGSGFPSDFVKRLIWQLCMALEYLHTECGVVHTDIKPNNIFLSYDSSVKDIVIRAHLANLPPNTYPARRINGMDFQTYVSRSLPLPPFSKCHPLAYTVQLADFGSARWIEKGITNLVQPLRLRAPEVILGLPWNEKIDIWSVGCLTFELLTGQCLFPVAAHIQWPEDEDVLARHLEVHGLDRLPQHMRQSSSELVNEDGTLRHIQITGLPKSSVKDRFKELEVPTTGDPESELDLAVSLVEMCIVLDPSCRASASELLHHPWLRDAEAIIPPSISKGRS